ncbi:MAG: bifunctional demethylmenaquinone methyltransferase/2-methoxy-6-polyprenyl-1,4-benzoquinol methylase UbiE [Bacteroidales bacterium]|nr:bifunctional demethylmenaquinone methyltransferase/2-methoxy-6-polyprenyl-1,4-benzoquinol methylase UbiE [Bacteroidales bacterium]
MQKKDQIQKMFDGIAPSYDRLNHLMSLGVDRLWRRKAVKELVDGTVQKILDVACGTGDSTIELAKRAGLGSTVIGVDISAGMMEPLMRKAAKAGVHDRIHLKVADGCDLPYADGTFHAVTCSFGIRNFEDKAKGLREFLRVLKPGGKMVILELSVPDGRRLRRLYNIYFMHIMPWIGGLVSGNKEAYRYLPASVQTFPAPEKFCTMIKDSGFRSVRFRTLTLGLCRMYIAEK